ncbi:MAG: hypothetical protein ACE5OZ_23130 [Candidatus Heimdallarchaeota archaeon]
MADRGPRKCVICGEMFVPPVQPGPVPKFCSPECRKTDWRAYMRERNEKKKELLRQDLAWWGKLAFAEARERGLVGVNEEEVEEGSLREDGRIDTTHDGWDFTPARATQYRDGEDKLVTKKLPAYNSIGTVRNRDLAIIETPDGPRVLAALELDKRKK